MAERTTTFEATAVTQQGPTREKIQLPQPLFDGTVNRDVMHQAVKAFLANQRQGNASTRTRGLVAGGNQKPWKQKGTGRARQGSIRAPQWVGGGTVFGPTPRSYAQYVPRQVRALARKSAFNARAREGAIYVIDRLDFEEPKTRRMRELLDKLGVDGRKVLILTDGVKPAVFLSARNLPNAHVMPYRDVSTYHILWSDVVVIESGALGGELPADEREADEGQGREDAAAAGEPTARGRKTARKAGARKVAARKAATKKAATRTARAERPAGKKAGAKKKPARKSTRKRGE
jgi:large subunit ribosomal protein L4